MGQHYTAPTRLFTQGLFSINTRPSSALDPTWLSMVLGSASFMSSWDSASSPWSSFGHSLPQNFFQVFKLNSFLIALIIITKGAEGTRSMLLFTFFPSLHLSTVCSAVWFTIGNLGDKLQYYLNCHYTATPTSPCYPLWSPAPPTLPSNLIRASDLFSSPPSQTRATLQFCWVG